MIPTGFESSAIWQLMPFISIMLKNFATGLQVKHMTVCCRSIHENMRSQKSSLYQKVLQQILEMKWTPKKWTAKFLKLQETGIVNPQSAQNEWYWKLFETKQLAANKHLSANSASSKIPSLALIKPSVKNRIRFLVQSVTTASSSASQLLRLEDLRHQLIKHPETVGLAVKEKTIPLILKLREKSEDVIIKRYAQQALAAVGYVGPPGGNGLRILSIDGGGIRGLAAIEILHHIEARTGKRILELFDFVCGVSTGAILASLLVAQRLPLDECDALYRKISGEVFQPGGLLGAGRLVWNHAYYDTTHWTNVLKSAYGEKLLIETSDQPGFPKMAIISAVLNLPTLQTFVFRNYAIPYKYQSQYLGSCGHKVWQAVRASAAAPGYFEEFNLDNYVHQDGGLIMNNPAAIAIHEAKLIWPREQIHCVLSLGTGRYIPPVESTPSSSTNLKTKLTKILDSATDTEGVHVMLHDLLPPKTYFRLNPYLTEYITLDENQPKKLEQLKTDTHMYLRRNEHKVNQALALLTKPRSKLKKFHDWIQLQQDLRS